MHSQFEARTFLDVLFKSAQLHARHSNRLCRCSTQFNVLTSIANDVQNSTLVSAKLTGLPVENYDDWVLFKIGNALGKAVKVDKQMMAIFGRVCIKVDLNKLLPPCMWISTFLQDVEYEVLQMIVLTLVNLAISKRLVRGYLQVFEEN